MAHQTPSGISKIHEDLQYLIRLLHDMLIDVGEEALAKNLPWIKDNTPLAEVQVSTKLVQTYSLAFQLLNMVEENTSNQLRRRNEVEKGKAAWRGLWAHQLKNLRDAGFSEEAIAETLTQTSVELVLTAHPTEAKRITVIEHHRELYLALVKRENPIWTPTEQRELEDSIKNMIERIWRTGEVYITKPTVQTERKSLEHYLKNIFPEAIRLMDRNLTESWKELGFEQALSHDIRPHIRLGSWVGGDRDGHPLVTPQVTEESLLDCRLNALATIHAKLVELRHKLSIEGTGAKVPPIITQKLREYTTLIGEKTQSILARNPAEPWRQFLSLLIERLPLATGQASNHEVTLETRYLYTYRRAEELIDDLKVLRKSLEEIHAHHIAETEVTPLIRLLEVIGFHLVAIDIRQNSDFHDRAIEQILAARGLSDTRFSQWSEEQRVAFLSSELGQTKPSTHVIPETGEEAMRAVGAYATVARYIRNFGREGIGAFILSMTRSLSDLLGVYFLAREAGLLIDTSDGPACPVPVVPLFETVDDLKTAPSIMQSYLHHPVVKRSLKHQLRKHETQPTQQIMIGYSDSNKDMGIVASQWTLHCAQREIADVARKASVRPCFFHGRGGTISRGAGPTDRFLEALPNDALCHQIRMTEQGETISYKYSNLLTATYHLELLTAGTHHYSTVKRTPIEATFEPVLEQLVETCGQKYRSLLESDGFMNFYRHATPIDALEHSTIGSRPSRRTGTHSLDDLRAIPWVFSWSQSRFMIPGWYGTGTGLDTLKASDEASYNRLVEAIPTSPFLLYLFTNIDESVQSIDEAIAAEYADLVEDEAIKKHFTQLIFNELNSLKAHLSHIFKKPLEQRRPYFSHTIAMRDEALEPLHRYQIKQLSQWRELMKTNQTDAANKMVPDLMLAISSIASGLKTTG